MHTTQDRSTKLVGIFKKILPSPFTIAILLSILTFVLALILTRPETSSAEPYFIELLRAWEKGLWDSSGGGLYFAFQMMLILVLGHILALTPAINKLIETLTKYCTTTANSAVIIALGSISLGLVNWGLGLIFGAIIARKVGEKFARENKPLNYGLIGAAAYVTMMVWHGGLSGSATTKSMEEGYLPQMMKNMNMAGEFPDAVPFDATIGSTMNIVLILACLLLIPGALYFIGKKAKGTKVPQFEVLESPQKIAKSKNMKGAEKLDYSRIFGMSLGILFLIFGIYQAVTFEGSSTFGFIQLNFINFMFLGLSLTLHKTIQNFSKALQTAIGDISGILIQFPFYFGILALVNSSGLIELFSESITSVANDYTLPLFTFFSAGVVNFFVPSGGGQWAIQGPIILETVNQLNADLPKTILGMAYGDQLTNMLQPFWALPLLGITKLKPQQLLPYTFLLFVLGFIIFSLGLLIF